MDGRQLLTENTFVKEKLLRKVADSQNWLRIKGKYTIQYNKSFLEQSCVVWHSFLTEENELDLERVQKAAIRLTLGEKYEN